jgi:hypothetical protein
MIHSLVETARFAMQHGDYDGALAYLDEIETHTEVLYKGAIERVLDIRRADEDAAADAGVDVVDKAKVSTAPRAPEDAPRNAKVIVKKKTVTPVPPGTMKVVPVQPAA